MLSIRTDLTHLRKKDSPLLTRKKERKKKGRLDLDVVNEIEVPASSRAEDKRNGLVTMIRSGLFTPEFYAVFLYEFHK